MSALELVPTGIGTVDVAVRHWGASTLLPGAFKDKNGNVLWADVQVACLTLDALDLQPRLNLPGVYVINGVVGFYAALQIALAQRAGYDIEARLESKERCVVELFKPGELRQEGHGRLVEFTIEEAKEAGWYDRNKANWTGQPRAMLYARAVTKAIRHNAPGVLRGIVAQLDGVAPTDLADELPPGAVPSAPAPEGVPADLRQDLLDGMRLLRDTWPPAWQHVTSRLQGVDAPAELRPLVAFGLLLDWLGDHPMPEPVETDEPTPEAVTDDEPESRGLTAEDGEETNQPKYDPADAADPSRPF